MRLLRPSIALVAAATLALPLSAQAQSCKAPPGTSGIDQYCESIPGAGGDRGKGDRDEGAVGIDRRTRQALEADGAAGRSILELDGRAGKRLERNRAHLKPIKRVDDGEPSSDVFSALGSAFGSGGGSGPAFTWFLLITALVLAAAGWMRYRRRA